MSGEVMGIALSFFKKRNNKWFELKKINDITESSRIIAFENDSTLWMTHGYKGAYLIEFDKSLEQTKEIRFFGEEHGFPSNLLISVYELNKNLI